MTYVVIYENVNDYLSFETFETKKEVIDFLAHLVVIYGTLNTILYSKDKITNIDPPHVPIELIRRKKREKKVEIERRRIEKNILSRSRADDDERALYEELRKRFEKEHEYDREKSLS